ncbi:MAG TPA: MFS transporter [Allosphingosinicella sp.]
MARSGLEERHATAALWAAWLIASVYYFYQYVMRSAPAVMVPQLGDAYGLGAVGLASLIGLFYYGYAPFSLVAGAAMDQLGPRAVVPVGALTMALGAVLFASGDPTLAQAGRFLQGAGGVFALIGAAYLATNYLPAAHAATLIGATQMFGMAGGSAGQFAVGPLVGGGMEWDVFWLGLGIAGLPIALLLFILMPGRKPGGASSGRLSSAVRATGEVFRNPQSILCGLVAGLMFLPTTIFDMVWGVRFLQEAHDVPYSMAVLRSASVPFGWIIGCPLLGWLSDRIGRRKPVIIGSAAVLLLCMAWMLYGPPGVLPPFALGLLAGIASGAAMLPYTIIKEVNRPEQSGTATGVINFINFSLSALLGPVFAGLLTRVSGGGERELAHYQEAFEPLVWGVGAAILLALLLRETGAAARFAPTLPAGGRLGRAGN